MSIFYLLSVSIFIYWWFRNSDFKSTIILQLLLIVRYPSSYLCMSIDIPFIIICTDQYSSNIKINLQSLSYLSRKGLTLISFFYDFFVEFTFLSEFPPLFLLQIQQYRILFTLLWYFSKKFISVGLTINLLQDMVGFCHIFMNFAEFYFFFIKFFLLFTFLWVYLLYLLGPLLPDCLE